jgi:hypothetical protein
MSELTILQKVYKDLKYSSQKFSKLFDAMDEDFKFAQGEQWSPSDVEELRKQGVKALAINKVKPIIKLITGIERQSKSDFVAFPEGKEDGLSADIATKLLKNASKTSDVQRKLSDQFKNGAICGAAFLEPYIDYSKDLINGDLRWKKISAKDIYLDPDFKEYDLSDCKYVVKVSKDLCKEDLELLFPDESSKIDKILNGQISPATFDNLDKHIQGLDYPSMDKATPNDSPEEDTYDLIDYYYKALKTVYYVAHADKGILVEAPSKEEALDKASQVEGAVVVKKKVPEIRLYQICGNQVFYDDAAPCAPRWRKYPIIPYFAELLTENIGNKVLNIQGVVRSIKDLQEEFNKRRTQELRHLNSSANSGFDIEKGQLDQDNLGKLKKFGSSPGIVIERKAGSNPLVRISPMPLSQGHAQLAEENAQDLKEASGVNPDLLASDSNSQSGRAILLRQRQGLVMCQEMLDNFAATKKIVGLFILSQLKDLYTVESALKVLGDAFIQEAFTVPVTAIIQRGLGKLKESKPVTQLEQSNMLLYPGNDETTPVVDPQTNQLAMAVDFDTAIETVNNVLNDSEFGKYDVSVGEGPLSETVRMSNFLALTDLAQQGVPIPPNVLIEMSLIPENEKKKILAQMEAAQQAQMQMSMQQAQIGAKPSQPAKE